MNVDGAVLENARRLLNLGGGTFGKAGHALNSDSEILVHWLNLGSCTFEIAGLSSNRKFEKVADSLNPDGVSFGMD